jgi:hypothetical protein
MDVWCKPESHKAQAFWPKIARKKKTNPVILRKSSPTLKIEHIAIPHKSRVKPEAEDGKGAHGESQAQAQF